MDMDPKKRGLGRGLNALFEDEETRFAEAPSDSGASAGTPEAAAAPGAGRTTLGIDLLVQGRVQPRKIFEEDSLKELASSIKSHGLLQPILVRESTEHDGKYEIIAGERRWRAAQKAQIHEVPVIIGEFTDIEALEIALIENLQREDLNPVDEAMGYKRLMEEHDYTQEKLAEALGKSRPYIANMVRLLGLPDVVLGHVERGDLSAGHARTLVGVKNAEDLAKEIISQGLSVRQTEELVAEAAGRPPKAKKSKGTAQKSADIIALEQELSNKLGVRVGIDTKDNKKGKVTIEWASLDQLDEILKKLSN